MQINKLLLIQVSSIFTKDINRFYFLVNIEKELGLFKE